MGKYGVKLGSTTSQQHSQGTKVSMANARPGDLVFFNTYKKDGHVAIYLGNGKFIGAQSHGVSIENMNSSYWKSRFTGNIRRVANGGNFGSVGAIAGVSSPSSGVRGYALRQAPSSVSGYIRQASSKYGVRPELISAIMKAESGFKPTARSGAGAYGLMQLLPSFGSGRYNPQTNVMLGTGYISTQIKKFKDTRLALAAYNAGPGRVGGLVKKYGNNWSRIVSHLPRETQTYVKRILSYL